MSVSITELIGQAIFQTGSGNSEGVSNFKSSPIHFQTRYGSVSTSYAFRKMSTFSRTWNEHPSVNFDRMAGE